MKHWLFDLKSTDEILTTVKVVDIAAAMGELSAIADDDEAAHAAEDSLHTNILRAIALGVDTAPLLARAVLRTEEIRSARWCA